MQNDKKYTVLFVCSSNVCRSPYCEFMLRRMVENDDDLRGKVDVCSSAVFNRSKSIFPKAAVGKYAPVPDPFLATSQSEYDKTMQVLKEYVTKYFTKLKAQIESQNQ